MPSFSSQLDTIRRHEALSLTRSQTSSLVVIYASKIRRGLSAQVTASSARAAAHSALQHMTARYRAGRLAGLKDSLARVAAWAAPGSPHLTRILSVALHPPNRGNGLFVLFSFLCVAVSWSGPRGGPTVPHTRSSGRLNHLRVVSSLSASLADVNGIKTASSASAWLRWPQRQVNGPSAAL